MRTAARLQSLRGASQVPHQRPTTAAQRRLPCSIASRHTLVWKPGRAPSGTATGGDSPHTYQGMTGPTWCVWPSHAVPKRGTDTRHQLDELKRHAQRSQRPHTQHEPIRTKRLEQGNPDRKQEVDWWVPGASSVGRCGSRGVCSRCGVSF